ncbi:hypothetical protein [Streptomyces sp. CB01881]|uniref:hypothetical protein n=1 Tax=Streptomyces sp. CB01881 TaxID=2078691 RepID=UPI00129C8A39|nr:hypothetical protein [Streptomyces sp. CB01881]
MSAPVQAEPAGAPEERPLLTPNEHTDQPLTPSEWQRRAVLLARVRAANHPHRR